MTSSQKHPFDRIRTVLQAKGPLAIALSGGLDSSVLLAAAARVLGTGRCLAVTVETPYVMREELHDGMELCRRLGVRREVLAIPIPEAVRNNPPLRCYLCKHALFAALTEKAASLGFPQVADGSNTDDLSDYRPGLKALQELGVSSPFLEAGLGKAHIRELARFLGLPESVSEKPAYACLMTRLEHGRPVTEELLTRVDKAETFLRTLGLAGCRVRVHGDDLARIELPAGACGMLWSEGLAANIARHLKTLGFHYITLDMEGYSRGSMNQPS